MPAIWLFRMTPCVNELFTFSALMVGQISGPSGLVFAKDRRFTKVNAYEPVPFITPRFLQSDPLLAVFTRGDIRTDCLRLYGIDRD
jgi:hypothetical protein